MATQKIAITVPPVFLQRLDEWAKKKGKSRSRFIVEELDKRLKILEDNEITRLYNQVCNADEIRDYDRDLAEEMIEMSERFLKKHLRVNKAVSGPWIDGKRWKVKVKRVYNDVRMLIKAKLKKKPSNALINKYIETLSKISFTGAREELDKLKEEKIINENQYQKLYNNTVISLPVELRDLKQELYNLELA